MIDPRRRLPSVNSLLENDRVRELLAHHPRQLVVDAVRTAVAEARASSAETDAGELERKIELALSRSLERSLVPVINATGVVLHTNLGRAPLPAVAIDAVRDAAEGYTNLEYDLERGERGSRYTHCVSLIRELTGAEDAIVVNNCAAALVLSLSALARGREVIVSRGELVEIGGSFRVPDIMQRSGATLVEVGTTNRTHLEDYIGAITDRTGAIAKVHRSNFSMQGFVTDVSIERLVPIAAEHDLPIVHDLGSGLLMSLEDWGLRGEPTAREALNAGATIVLMSGDKLLGGPQAGIVAGRARAVARLRKDPFARAMRVDKMTIAALGATLELYRDPARATREIPALAMITADPESVRQRCDTVAGALSRNGIHASVVATAASVGAGAFPAHDIPSFAVRLGGKAPETESSLRRATPPIIARVADDAVLLDLRSVPPESDSLLLETIIEAYK
ncbi:MAG TPA: L-seryl-tRNA(Sec) selenium transferase [Gemmatimonadaceae bacterium]